MLALKASPSIGAFHVERCELASRIYDLMCDYIGQEVAGHIEHLGECGMYGEILRVMAQLLGVCEY